MTRNKFLAMLGMELASILVVIIAFAAIESRPVASVVSAIPFLFIGGYVIVQLARTAQPLRYAAIYVAVVHLIMTVVIAVRRVMFWDLPLEEILLFGTPLPVFHKVSQACFWSLVAATCYDMFRHMRRDLERQGGAGA